MTEKTGVLDSHHLGEVLKLSSKRLGERCGAAAVELLARRLTEYIGTAEDDGYSYVWRNAIEEHEQDSYKDDARSALVDAVRDATLGASAIDTPEAREAVKLLLQSPYPTLVRVGIYACGEHYGSIGRVFWECVNDQWFVDIPYWHEIYWFIKKSFIKFSAAERSRFLGIVDGLKGDWNDESKQEEWDETQKRDLLHPASGLGDSEVDMKYQELVERWGPVRDHPDFHAYTSGGWVGERSPIASDALIAMSNEELIKFLKNFAPSGHEWDGPTYRGLASALSAAVRASEDGFATSIELFADLARPYQHGLLGGLKERWADDKRNIDWVATLTLVRRVVTMPEFKAELEEGDTQGWEPSVHWVISDIAALLKSATGSERHLPVEHYVLCLEILRLILSSIQPTEVEQSADAVSHAINSSRGRTLEAFIHLSIAMRREEVAANQGDAKIWSVVGPIFESELASSERGKNADFAALAGMYCVNLHYMNSHWTESNFDRIFSSSNEAAWKNAAQGFSYQRYLYDWLYKKLVEGGHLRKMVFTDGLKDQVADRALQFLGLAYLQDMESLDGGGLLTDLIVGLKVKELKQLCWFFWTLRGGEPSARSPKILAFWQSVAERVRQSGHDLPELQSALSQLIAFIQELSPTLVEALVEVAPHAQVGHHGYLLIEHLARLASEYPNEVATIYKAAMTGFLPDYDKKNIVECVTILADAGAIDEAEWICNEYANQGSTLLKETYENIRAQQRAKANTGNDDI
ncbi:hypothetical protein [Massilia soli]|uniref:DUF4020 domain-containing protein n=1 Tax=Massilia soli TaxID=2792854 RepID=A0ABS7SMJ3_9BURK|nr:hypothetical protein [Massilia soli]MBZ2207169.1 hypothetical protein [Massilia soli]